MAVFVCKKIRSGFWIRAWKAKAISNGIPFSPRGSSFKVYWIVIQLLKKGMEEGRGDSFEREKGRRP